MRDVTCAAPKARSWDPTRCGKPASLAHRLLGLAVALSVSGCSCVLPEEVNLLSGATRIAVGANVDVVAANGCTDADFELEGTSGKVGLVWIEPPTCVKTGIAYVRSVTWNPRGVFAPLDAGLTAGVWQMTARAERAGQTKLEVDVVTSAKGDDLKLALELEAMNVDRLALAPRCTPRTGVLPADADLHFDWAMYAGQQRLGGWGYYPFDAPGLTVVGVKNGVMTLRSDPVPRALRVTSSVDPSLALDLRLVDASSFDRLDVTANRAYLEVGARAPLVATPTLGGQAPCLEDAGHFSSTFSLLTPGTCTIDAGSLWGTSAGTCTVRARLDGAALEGTLSLEVREPVAWVEDFAPPDAGLQLRSIFVGSWGEVYVGATDYVPPATAAVPVVLHRTDAGWSQVAVPAPDGGRIDVLWGAAPDDLWAAGPRLGVMHFDGGSWSPMNPGADVEVSGIWGSGPADVWFAGRTTGADAGGWLARWNGTAFAPAKEARDLYPLDIHGSGPADVWATAGLWTPNRSGLAGDGGVARFDGTRWTLLPVRGDESSRAMTTVWLVRPGEALLTNGVAVYRVSGDGGVDRQPVARSRSGYRATWSSSPADVYVVGDLGAYAHFDGVGWHAVDVGPETLIGVSGSGPDDVYLLTTRRVLRR